MKCTNSREKEDSIKIISFHKKELDMPSEKRMNEMKKPSITRKNHSFLCTKKGYNIFFMAITVVRRE
jgi:hypothetical protein